jgi:hypothetical protein
MFLPLFKVRCHRFESVQSRAPIHIVVPIFQSAFKVKLTAFGPGGSEISDAPSSVSFSWFYQFHDF